MQVEIFTVCRELRVSIPSTDILGIHSGIDAAALPVRLVGSYILLGVRFIGAEADAHQFEIRFIDDDGHPVARAIQGGIRRNDTELKHEVQNHKFHLNAVSLPKHGDYWFDLLLDGAHTHRLPFSVHEIH